MASPNARQRLLDRGETQLSICTKHCGARCCRYVTIPIPTPVAEQDWDEIRWWLAHEGIRVTKDDEGWMVEVETRCRHLQASGACGVYDARMDTCRDYDPETCEFALEVVYEVELTSEVDLADYLERRALQRGARVAAAIRAAERLRASGAPPELVQIRTLEPRP
jgi:Fe-S-cluster containining protein